MSGFSDPIIGGGGDLVYPAIKSPNFQLSPLQGWSIDKDGNAYFESVTIGQGTVRVTFASSAPSNPNAGDVWFDLANGTVQHWDGSAWQNFQYGSGAIESGAIGLGQLGGSVTSRALGGITTTIASVAPSSPVSGDMWINSASGYQINQYDGTSWNPVTWTGTNVLEAGTISGSLIEGQTITGSNIASGTITAGNIQAGTITATELASNIVVAGIVDSTTITGAQIVADGTSGEFLAYSGTPAAGNLIASVSPLASTDKYGNPYPDGFQIGSSSQGPYIQLLPGNPASLSFLSGTSEETSPAQIKEAILNAGGVAEYLRVALDSAQVTNSQDYARVAVRSGAKDGSFPAEGRLTYYDTAGTENVIAIWGSNGLTAARPGSNPSVAETWHTATLTNGWTGTLAYRLTAQGDLQISADLVAGTTTNGTTIYTFPSQYRPAAKRRIPAAFDGSVAAGGNPYFILNIDGTFTVHWVTSTQTNGGFDTTVRLA